MSTLTKRRDQVSKSFHLISRIFLHDRRKQLRIDIKNLLSDKTAKDIRESYALMLLQQAIKLMMFLSTSEEDVKHELININRRLNKIEINFHKTTTKICHELERQT